MKFINKIRIRYFRSLYDCKFEQISETLTVFTGSNDIGKSNVLRALNLFFNDETDPEEEILFERDFSKLRKKELKERIKTRQLIQITVEMSSPPQYNSLPRTFKVSRNFDRYNEGSDFIFENKISSDKKKLASARRFINSIQFTYIPAIKDKNTFLQILQSLKSHLPPLQKDDLDRFNRRLQEYGDELKQDFKTKLQLSPMLSLPSTAKELFSSLDFSIADDIISTPLAQRGDGIRCRFIPSIMNYITQNSLNRHIWAIEEPENSLEFLRAIELNDTLEKEYSKKAQILVTSHSPAFVGSIADDSKKVIYLLDRDNEGLVSVEKIDRNLLLDEQKIKLSKKLGYIGLQKDLAECLQNKIAEAQKAKQEYETLSENITSTSKAFILCVEGESDKIILENAWKKLHPCQQIPFYIHVCYADSQIKSVLERIILDNFEGKTFIGLWDFDSAYSQWNGLSKKWSHKQITEANGLLNKKQNESIYAMLLPVPDNRNTYASNLLGDKSALSIELLFPNNKLRNCTHTVTCLGGGKIIEFDKKKKLKFADKTSSFSAEDFVEFNKIFGLIQQIENGEFDD